MANFTINDLSAGSIKDTDKTLKSDTNGVLSNVTFSQISDYANSNFLSYITRTQVAGQYEKNPERPGDVIAGSYLYKVGPFVQAYIHIKLGTDINSEVAITDRTDFLPLRNATFIAAVVESPTNKFKVVQGFVSPSLGRLVLRGNLSAGDVIDASFFYLANA